MVKKYGRLQPIRCYRKLYGIKHPILLKVWECICDCGRYKDIREDALRSGSTKSCGCLNNATRGGTQRIHGESWNRTAEYRIWCDLKSRCLGRVGHKGYKGRGISVCQQWLGPAGYLTFLRDMGRRPTSKHSIDRIDNDGDYCRENCRWATAIQQNRNTRVVKKLTFRGESLPLSVWAEKFGIKASTIHTRIYAGWSVEDALTVPTQDIWTHRRKHFINNGRGW